MKFLLLLLLCITPSVISVVRKMEVIWLNNGGQILSNSQDWIKLQINTPNLNNTIICTQGNGYTYRPGDTRRFYNLWFPVENYVSISLTQYNLFSKDDAVYIESPIDSSKTGFYQFKLSLDQFRQGVTIGISFEGIGVNFTTNDYKQYADYYMLLRLNDIEVGNNTYGLDSTCYLAASNSNTNSNSNINSNSNNINKTSSQLKSFGGYYQLIHLAIVVALLAIVI